MKQSSQLAKYPHYTTATPGYINNAEKPWILTRSPAFEFRGCRRNQIWIKPSRMILGMVNAILSGLPIVSRRRVA